MKTKAKTGNGHSKTRFQYHPERAQPKIHQSAPEIQAFRTIAKLLNALKEVPVQISRLLTAHEIILQGARASARKAADMGDDGTNDLLVSDVVRTNEKQVWFLAEHLVGVA
jgi:starvation-inducible DNA-binding protein